MLRNFKTIAEKCINGKITGVFVFGSGYEANSGILTRNYNEDTKDQYPYHFNGDLNINITKNGKYHYHGHGATMFDVMEFIKD